jgi:hypothetical protein
MSKRKPECTIFVDMSHKSGLERVHAAHWAMELYGADRVDIMSLGPDRELGLWFREAKEANWFSLRWC